MSATTIAAAANAPELQPRPEDQLGIWMTSALVVGSMIGAGIFLLPVALAPLGINAIAGWVISSIGALCIAFSLAQLTRAGGAGIQAHIERTFGPTVAYLVAWSFWCSNWAGNAGLAIAFAAALSWISPGFGGPWFVVSAAIGAVVALTLVNASGVRSAGGLALVTVAIKLFPLLAVMAIMVIHGVSGTFQPLPPVPLYRAQRCRRGSTDIVRDDRVRECHDAGRQGSQSLAHAAAGDHGRNHVRRPALPPFEQQHPTAPSR